MLLSSDGYSIPHTDKLYNAELGSGGTVRDCHFQLSFIKGNQSIKIISAFTLPTTCDKMLSVTVYFHSIIKKMNAESTIKSV